MQIIPLQAIPNQSLSIQLESNLYEITVKSSAGITSMDVIRDGATLVSGCRAVGNFLILPYRYLEVGNMFFYTQGDALPAYDQFGITQNLYYASVADLANARSLPFFYLPDGEIPIRDGGTW